MRKDFSRDRVPCTLYYAHMSIFGKWKAVGCVLAAFAGLSLAEAARGEPSSAVFPAPPVVIDFFYEPGCHDCERVKAEVLPELDARFAGFYVLNRHEMGLASSMARLAAFQERLGVSDNEPVSMYVDYRHVFSGFTAIRDGLMGCVDELLAERQVPGWTPPAPIPVAGFPGEAAAPAERRLERFTLPMVLAGGLLDGINPCAVSTLVFLMSLLAVSGVRGRGLLAMGASFCLASFVTYTALGLGLLRALHLLAGFGLARFWVGAVMAGVLGVFAFLSFRDALRYRRSGDPSDVSLQLPEAIKRMIRRVIKRGLGAGSLALGGLVIGAAVTALESVCTGQVYVPTLALVARTGNSTARAWSYLLAYNAMFVLPLVAVFLLVYFGLRTEALLRWSRRNVVLSKVLLGIFFLGTALLIWLM